MSGKVIGLNLNHGFAGSYARQPDLIVNTHPNKEASANIPFGHALMVATGGVKLPTASITAADFAGVAGRQVQTQLSYTNQNGPGEYKPNDPVSCFQRGRINVECKIGTPALNGPVYLAISTANSNVVGDFTATVGTLNTDTILLPNCKWGGTKDSNNIVELVILKADNG
jgi:hypothetical protein